MAYRVAVQARFEAAHGLLHYRGQPEPLHGHSYRVEVVFESEGLDGDDLAVDFVTAKKAVQAIASELDYRNLNDHPAFLGKNTSAENLALLFASRLQNPAPLSPAPLSPARVVEVTVWEGPENRATWKTAPG